MHTMRYAVRVRRAFAIGVLAALFVLTVVVYLSVGEWWSVGAWFTRPRVIIVMSASGFDPKVVRIRKGDTVKFENRDSTDHWPASNLHPIHDVYPSFDPRYPVRPGTSWQFRFTRSGTWYFHDHLKPTEGGKVIVGAEYRREGAFAPKSQGEKVMARIEKEQDPDKQAERIVELSYLVGPDIAVELLNASELPRSGQTHLLAHRIGEIAYELYGIDALPHCQNDMFSGCTHGLILTATADIGFDGIVRMVEQCLSHSPFQYHMCLHGAGHAFLTLSDYDIFPALENCDELIDRTKPESIHCYNGVFMENVLGDHGGFAPPLHPYVSAVDLNVPCDRVEERYRTACYFNQASWWVQVSQGQLAPVAEQCNSVPFQYRAACADSFGRVVASQSTDERAIRTNCQLLRSELRTACITSVAKAEFAVGDTTLPFALCNTIDAQTARISCASDLISLMRESVENPEQFKILCSQFNEELALLCRSQ